MLTHPRTQARIGAAFAVSLLALMACGASNDSDGSEYGEQGATSNPLPIGNFDGFSGSAAYGWTCDSSSYWQPIDVHFYRDGAYGQGGVFLGAARADRPRESAVGALCGGYSSRGFQFALPASMLDGRAHSIYAYAINTPSGENPLLGVRSFTGSSNPLPIGYLDRVDATGARGWTCDPSSYARPVDVHFYQDGAAGAGGVFVGATSASRSREAAVGTLCGGYSSHGFLFPLPASMLDGRSHTLHAYAINTPSGENPLLGVQTFAGSGGSGAATGLFDPGFRQAVARSELGDRRTITIGRCLYDPRYGDVCPAGVTCGACQISGATTYAQSNFFSTVSPAPSDGFWIVDHNIDQGSLGGAYDSTCNSGPPDQSAPVATTIGANGIFAFSIGAGSGGGRRANMRVRNQFNALDRCPGADSYLAIGANKSRGNGGRDVGAFIRTGAASFSNDQSRVTFRAAVDHCVDGPCLFYFNVHARWNGKPRLLVVTIGHLNHPGEQRHAHWNWPARESYFYNGYDIAYLRCEGAGVPCLSLDANGTSYAVNASALLSRASDLGLYDDAIPLNTRIAVEGVSWAIETAGRTEVGGWVEGMNVGAAP